MVLLGIDSVVRLSQAVAAEAGSAGTNHAVMSTAAVHGSSFFIIPPESKARRTRITSKRCHRGTKTRRRVGRSMGWPAQQANWRNRIGPKRERSTS
jgi:hypothetical protein